MEIDKPIDAFKIELWFKHCKYIDYDQTDWMEQEQFFPAIAEAIERTQLGCAEAWLQEETERFAKQTKLNKNEVARFKIEQRMKSPYQTILTAPPAAEGGADVPEKE